MDQGPEDPERTVDGLLVQSRQLGRFRYVDVNAKTRDNFSDPVRADFPVLKHFLQTKRNF